MRTMRVTLGICLAACGGDNVNHLADAPNNPDTPVDVAQVGPVTLTVTSEGLPAVGVQVYFQNADQSIIAMPTTDANGDATATVEIGAFVTAIDPPPPPPPGFVFGLPTVRDSLHTWAGVKPGDHLHLDLNAVVPGITTAAITIIVPTDVGANQYALYTSCGGGEFIDITPPPVGSGVAAANAAVPATVTVCAATQDILVETLLAGEGTVPVSSFFVPAVAIADGAALDFSAQTYTAVGTTDFDYTNIHVAITSVSVTEEMITPTGRLFLANTSATVDATDAMASLNVPAAAATALTISDILPSDVSSDQLILDWGVPGTDVAVDVGGSLLHAYASLPTFDAASHSMIWQEVGGLDGDLVVSGYTTTRVVDATNHVWSWTLASPRGTTPKATYPTIPTNVFDYNTVDADNVTIQGLVNAKVPGGYDAVRAQVMNINPPEGIIAGATGHAVIETVAAPPLKPSRNALPLSRKPHRR